MALGRGGVAEGEECNGGGKKDGKGSHGQPPRPEYTRGRGCSSHLGRKTLESEKSKRTPIPPLVEWALSSYVRAERPDSRVESAS